MHRFFGKKKEEVPGPTISETMGRLEGRSGDLDGKIAKLDEELRRYNAQMKTARGPAKENIKKRALQVLRRKKMYEQQRDSLASQSFNLDQVGFAIETSKDTMDTVKAMKSSAKELKNAYNSIKISEIEDVQDDLEDLLIDANEMQEALSRSYALPGNVDEDDLEDELAALENEWDMEKELGMDTPSYIPSEFPAVPSGNFPSTAEAKNSTNERKTAVTTGGVQVDEYGLPIA